MGTATVELFAFRKTEWILRTFGGESHYNEAILHHPSKETSINRFIETFEAVHKTFFNDRQATIAINKEEFELACERLDFLITALKNEALGILFLLEDIDNEEEKGFSQEQLYTRRREMLRILKDNQD